MFVVKYHAKGHRTKYLGDKKEVVNKRCAIAFGEGCLLYTSPSPRD